jgi:hypothetical protein
LDTKLKKYGYPQDVGNPKNKIQGLMFSYILTYIFPFVLISTVNGKKKDQIKNKPFQRTGN